MIFSYLLGGGLTTKLFSDTSSNTNLRTMNVEVATSSESGVPLTIHVDSWNKSNYDSMPRTLTFSVKENFKIEFNQQFADKVGLKINSKKIKLTSYQKGDLIMFEVTQDNLNQILEDNARYNF